MFHQIKTSLYKARNRSSPSVSRTFDDINFEEVWSKTLRPPPPPPSKKVNFRQRNEMHGKIDLLQLFQKHYSFLSNDAFLTENFDDFSHLLLKNTVFSEKKRVFAYFCWKYAF